MAKKSWKCPKCGSGNITKFTIYQKKTKSGCGCIGCLLVIIIIILLAPILIPLFGLGAIAGVGGLFTLVTDHPEAGMILGGIGLFLLVIYAFQNSGYICERCGKKFK